MLKCTATCEDLSLVDQMSNTDNYASYSRRAGFFNRMYFFFDCGRGPITDVFQAGSDW